MSDRELFDACLPGWVEMYLAGEWTLAEFIEHVDRMCRVLCGLR